MSYLFTYLPNVTISSFWESQDQKLFIKIIEIVVFDPHNNIQQSPKIPAFHHILVLTLERNTDAVNTPTAQLSVKKIEEFYFPTIGIKYAK